MAAINREDSMALTYIRTCAMLMILMCHICQAWLSQPALGQVFTVGVPIFFILSGFLYGQAAYTFSFSWFCRQLKKILIPLYLFYGIAFLILHFVSGPQTLDPAGTIRLLLCLQGLRDGSLGELNVGHLWFITFILICYGITPLLQAIRRRWSKKKILALLVCVFVVQTVLLLFVPQRYAVVNSIEILLYAAAFFFSSFWNRKIDKKVLGWLSLVMFLGVTVRLVWKHFADLQGGLIAVAYDRLVAGYCNKILAVWICAVIWKAVSLLPKFFTWMYPAVKLAAKYSYEVYIVHMVLCAGALNIRAEGRSLWLDLGIFLVLTVLWAVVLHEVAALLSGKARGIGRKKERTDG